MANKQNETVRGRLRTSDLIPRILCVLLAVVIWLYVMLTDGSDFELQADVSVTPENVAVLTEEQNLSIISGYTGKVTVVAVGQRSVLSPEEIYAYVDVSGIDEPGRHQLPVEVRLPYGCTVQSVVPASVEVYVDTMMSKSIPVVVDARLYVSDPLILGVAEPDLDSVTVTGPADAVAIADHATVTLEFANEVKSGITARSELVVYTAEGTVVDNPYLTLSDKTVGVTIPVYMEKTFSVTPVSKYGYLTAENAVMKVSPSTLTLRGDPQVLSAIGELEAVFDETGLTDSNRATATVTLPENVENADGSNKVTVTVEHRGTVQKEIAVSKISLSNPHGLTYTIDAESVNVKLRAPTSIASELLPDDFRLTGELNYTGTSGKVEVPLTLIVPAEYGNSVYALGSSSVFVTIGK